SHPAGRRHAAAGPEERPALLLPPVEDDPRPNCGRRRGELLRSWGPWRHPSAPPPPPRRGPVMLSDKLTERMLAPSTRLKIGVLGDLFLDRYLDIDAALTEPSVETGLDAYQVTAVRSYPGAAGTVINNLAALGVGRILPVSAIGDDGEGYELRQALAKMPAV